MNLRLIYIILLGCIGSKVMSQEFDEKNFVLYTTKEGLTHNYINVITQDTYGYIWVATYKGLNRFDGTGFRQFYADSGRNSLPQNLLLKLKWFNKDQLAIPTLSGLHIINTQTLEGRNLFIPADPIHPSYFVNKVFDASADHEGNTFIITTTGFYHFNNKKQLIFRYDYFSEVKSPKIYGFGWNINKINDNTLLLSTFAGPYIYYIKQKDIHPVKSTDDPFYQRMAASQKLMTGLKDEDYATKVIMSNQNGLSLFDIPAHQEYFLRSPFPIENVFAGDERATFVRLNDSTFILNSKKNGFYLIHYDRLNKSYRFLPKLFFDGYICNSFLIDNNHRLWIATNKGLFREKRPTGKIEQVILNEKTEKEQTIHSISVANNKVFAGTDNGMLVLEGDDLKKLQRIDLSKEGAEYVNFFFCSAADKKDTLYTGLGGFWINTKNLRHGKIALAPLDTTFKAIDLAYCDSRENIFLKKVYVNTFYYREPNGKFRILDYNKQLSQIGVTRTIAEDPEGNIWFGGWTIQRFNRKLQQFDTILKEFPKINNNTSLSSNIVFDKRGNIYFGTWENGLIIYDMIAKKFTHVTRREGLPDNTIQSLCYHNNKIWMGTESGLASYEISTKRISSFGTADGIPTDPMASYFLSYDSVNQQLYGAFRNIIFHFNPDQLTKNESPPNFLIESVMIAGKETIYHPASNIDLSYKKNNIVINLNSINFEDAYQQRFAYRLLKKGDEPWLETGSQRSIIFSDLSPGIYKLQAKVYTRNQAWPEQVQEITINIRPPIWGTTWFLLLAIAFILFILYLLYRLRIRQIHQKADIDKAMAQTEMKALHAQMNPHFIFNCLNSIREMILNNENKQASHYLNKFAQLIRITLNQSSKPFVSLENTIDYLQRYIEMEKIRTSNFTHTLEIDEDLIPGDIALPPMLIQPFIENAIWHGVASPGQPMKIDIRFEKEQQQLLCIIDDNGIGIETSLKKKETQLGNDPVGIDNIKQRIRVLNEKYNMQSTITIEDKANLVQKKETGTIVKLRLPIKKIDV